MQFILFGTCAAFGRIGCRHPDFTEEFSSPNKLLSDVGGGPAFPGSLVDFSALPGTRLSCLLIAMYAVVFILVYCCVHWELSPRAHTLQRGHFNASQTLRSAPAVSAVHHAKRLPVCQADAPQAVT